MGTFYNSDNTKHTTTIEAILGLCRRLMVGYGAVSVDYNILEVFLRLDNCLYKFHIRYSILVSQNPEGLLIFYLSLGAARFPAIRLWEHALDATSLFQSPFTFNWGSQNWSLRGFQLIQ